MKKNIRLVFFLYFLLILISCQENNYKKYIIKRKFDISKPHHIEAKYFIGTIRDTVFKDSCYIKMYVLHRIGGSFVKKGQLSVTDLNKKIDGIEHKKNRYIIFNTPSPITIKLKAGYYSFNADSWPDEALLDISTDKVLIKENSYVEMYFLLGSLVQW